MTTVQLQIASDQMSDSALQGMARALQDDILRHTDAGAELPQEAPQAHHKGDPISLGVLLVTFMTSGTAVAFVNVLKSYLERDQSLSFTVEDAEGRKTTVSAANLKDAQALHDTLMSARE